LKWILNSWIRIMDFLIWNLQHCCRPVSSTYCWQGVQIVMIRRGSFWLFHDPLNFLRKKIAVTALFNWARIFYLHDEMIWPGIFWFRVEIIRECIFNFHVETFRDGTFYFMTNFSIRSANRNASQIYIPQRTDISILFWFKFKLIVRVHISI